MVPNGWWGDQPGLPPDVLQMWGSYGLGPGSMSSWERRAQWSCQARRQAGRSPGRGSREGNALTCSKKAEVPHSLARIPQSNCKSWRGLQFAC